MIGCGFYLCIVSCFFIIQLFRMGNICSKLSPSEKKARANFHEFLDRLKLTSYEQKLVQEGVLSVVELVEYTDSELDNVIRECGIKSAHAIRLKKALKNYREGNPVTLYDGASVEVEQYLSKEAAPKKENIYGDYDESETIDLLVFNGYVEQGVLGQGAFGVVYRVSKNGKLYVIKFQSTKNNANTLKEIVALSKMPDHSNIVSIVDTFEWKGKLQGKEEDSYLCIVMPYFEGGTLADHLNKAQMSHDEVCLTTMRILIAYLFDSHPLPVDYRS